MLQLSPAFAIIRMEQGIQLRAGDEQIHLLETDDVDVVIGLLAQLQEGASRDQLVATVEADDGESLVDALLDELSAEQLLTPLLEPNQQPVLWPYLAALYPNVCQDPVRLREFATAGVRVVGENRTARLLEELLTEYGIPSGPQAMKSEPQTTICVTEQPDLSLLLEANRRSCAERSPCLFVDLSHGRHATIGPFYAPGEACYRCFRDRLHQNTAAPDELRAADGQMLREGPLPAIECPPGFRHQVAGIVAHEVFSVADGAPAVTHVEQHAHHRL